LLVKAEEEEEEKSGRATVQESKNDLFEKALPRLHLTRRGFIK